MSVVQAALFGLTAIPVCGSAEAVEAEYAVYLVLAASIGIDFWDLQSSESFSILCGRSKMDPDPA